MATNNLALRSSIWEMRTRRSFHRSWEGHVYCVLLPLRDTGPVSYLTDDAFHYKLQEGLRWGSREHHLWIGTATRYCRTWNMCFVAAALTGLQPTTPALILADRLGELGEAPRLEGELRYQTIGNILDDERIQCFVPVPPMPIPLDYEFHIGFRP